MTVVLGHILNCQVFFPFTMVITFSAGCHDERRVIQARTVYQSVQTLTEVDARAAGGPRRFGRPSRVVSRCVVRSPETEHATGP